MEKFVVNKETCIGCGACSAIASSTFTMGDDGLAETIEGKEIKENLTETEVEEAVDAKEGCPVDAIRLEETN